ncbi:MAG: 6-bladed beta-propeller, partial [Anaerolineales bacterium]
ARSFNDIFHKVQEIRLSLTDSSAIGYPRAFCVRKDGDIIVLDETITKRVFLFDSLGNFLRVVGRRGEGPGEYQSPTSVTCDNRGRIIVADNQLSRINYYDADGNFLSSFGLPFMVAKISCNPMNNTIYVQRQHNIEEAVYVFREDGHAIFSIKFYEEAIPYAPAAMGGMAFDSSGALYWIGPLKYEIQKYIGRDRIGLFTSPTNNYLPPEINLNNRWHPDREWYKSFSHIFGIDYLSPGFLLVHFDNPRKKVEGFPKLYMEIFSSNGIFLKVVEPPRALTYASGRFLYTMGRPELGSSGELLNPIVTKYEISSE